MSFRILIFLTALLAVAPPLLAQEAATPTAQDDGDEVVVVEARITTTAPGKGVGQDPDRLIATYPMRTRKRIAEQSMYRTASCP